MVLPAPCRGGGLSGGKQQLFDGSEQLDFETDFADWPKWPRTHTEELCSAKRKPELESPPPAKRHRTESEESDECAPKRRISMMWSPRLRQKDERRRVFKISLNKLRRIEDPESFLRRSVLVNNTVKRLQREIREEKFAKYPSSWGASGPVVGGPEEEELFGEDFLRVVPRETSRSDPYRTSNEFRYPAVPCSSQFREVPDGAHLNPPILDSVVYHSLLASLES